MIQPLFRILLMAGLVYGVYRIAPVMKPGIKDALKNSDVSKGLVLGDAAGLLDSVYNGGSGSDEKTGGNEIQKTVNEVIKNGKDSLSNTVQDDLNKAKNSVKDVANEQFCRTLLKTMQEQCGKYYCDE